MEAKNSLKALTSPEVERGVAALVAKAAAEDEAGKIAAQAPLPGPAREAFSVCPGVRVGPYTVRPACDRDLKVLDRLGNSYFKMVMFGADDIKNGQDAYELCWIMTRPTGRDVKRFVAEQGLDALREAADEEFGDLATGDLMAVVMEASRQIGLSCATAVGHRSQDVPGENGEAAKSDRPPSGAR